MTLEQQHVLGDVHSMVSAIAEDVKLLRVELLGGIGVGSDTRHGRLPRVEAAVHAGRQEQGRRFVRMGRRLGRLERRQLKWSSYAVAVAAIWSMLCAGLGFAIEIGMRVWFGKH
jgi:hypothetical protein